MKPSASPAGGKVLVCPEDVDALEASHAAGHASARDNTLVVRLDAGQARLGANNFGTIVAVSGARVRPAPVRRASFEELFTLNYRTIRDTCTSFDDVGVAVIAIDALDRRVAGAMFVGARCGRANAAIVGRHSEAQLLLEADPLLSLRHLAVVVCPLEGKFETTFRVMDLHTPRAFTDERSRKLEALISEGPVFVSCGRYSLFFFNTGDGLMWPDDPADGWACVPERVYLGETDAEPDRWARRRRGPRTSASRGSEFGDITLVGEMVGPSYARGRRLLAEGEVPLGMLRVTVGDSEETLIVGPRAADQGILLGRYDRCDGDGLLAHERSISRVHLLLLRVGGQLYAIDTASTYGSFPLGRGQRMSHKGREARVVCLSDGHDVVLADDIARVAWQG